MVWKPRSVGGGYFSTKASSTERRNVSPISRSADYTSLYFNGEGRTAAARGEREADHCRLGSSSQERHRGHDVHAASSRDSCRWRSRHNGSSSPPRCTRCCFGSRAQKSQPRIGPTADFRVRDVRFLPAWPFTDPLQSRPAVQRRAEVVQLAATPSAGLRTCANGFRPRRRGLHLNVATHGHTVTVGEDNWTSSKA